ncbi:MAG TPA: aldehyde dehydrogenase family protein [Acidimicrobiales bacterium]|nr:aldehyde dehydrogenase family protein [Acidimicrobiales bacterium]
MSNPGEVTAPPGESRLLIDGKLVDAEAGATYPNVNPATEEVIGHVADASASDTDTAIEAARRAFDTTTWSTDRQLRRHCLYQLQAALESERELFRTELISEVGTPLLMTYGPQLDMPLTDAVTYPADAIADFPWERELVPVGEGAATSRRVVVKEAAGVVGAIVPWNFPLEISLHKLAQALATGNSVVLKAAPDTPWNATHLGRLIAEQTDIPPGVVNVITSSSHQRGQQLVTDPRVDLISFTGSTTTGRRIMELGAPTLKRLFLELGGKSANIVLDDADFVTALAGAIFVCINAGQGCALPTRILLPRSRYDEGVDIVAENFKSVKYGDPTDPEVLAGPVINEKQRDRVMGYIDKGVAEGARLVQGGKRPGHLKRGYYVEPTLFADVENSMTIAQEEIFGPVLVLVAYDDDDDAVRIANDSIYGLSGVVNSGSLERGLAVARRIRTGTIGVNGGNWYAADSPFGGYKASGIGRQGGIEGFEQYLETKTIAYP